MEQSQNSSDDTSREKTRNELLELYIENMDPYERVAYEIAKKNLESSYDMEKSIGFLDFIKQNNYVIINDK